MCFPVNFAKFLRTFFLQNTGRLLLNILAIMQHMFSLQNLLYNWLVVWNKTVDMLLKPVKLLKKEQFVPLYYRLPPVEGVTIDTQVVLHWMDYPPKTSSPNSTWPWDFHGVSSHLMIQINCLSLSFIVCNISDFVFCYCSCWSFWSEFFSINVQWFVILSFGGSWLWVTA